VDLIFTPFELIDVSRLCGGTPGQ